MNKFNVIILVAIHSASCWAMEQLAPDINVTYYDSDNEQQERKSVEDREALRRRVATRRRSMEQLAVARSVCKCGVDHQDHAKNE